MSLLDTMAGGVETWLGRSAFRARVNDFYDELSEQLRANVSVGQYLRNCLQYATRKKQPIATAYRHLLTEVERGATFSRAAQGYLSTDNLILIEAGERVARIADGVEAASFANKAKLRLQAVFVNRLAGPLALVAGVLMLTLILGLQTIPQFLVIIKVEQMGPAFRAIYYSIEFIKHWWWAVTPAAIAFVALVIWSVPHAAGRLRNLLDILPPWSLYRQHVASNLLIALSGLVRNNVSLQESFVLLSRGATAYKRSHVEHIRRLIGRGVPFSQAIETGLMPPAIVERLALFESAGQLEPMLRRIGFENLDRSIALLDRAVAAAASVIRIVAGIVLAWVVYDLFSLGTVVQKAAQAGGMGG